MNLPKILIVACCPYKFNCKDNVVVTLQGCLDGDTLKYVYCRHVHETEYSPRLNEKDMAEWAKEARGRANMETKIGNDS